MSNVTKGETRKGLDCAYTLVLNNGAPISWASSIMSVYATIGMGGQIPALSSQTLVKVQ